MDSTDRLFATIVVATLLTILGSGAVYEWGQVERARLHCAPATSGSAP